LTRWAGVEDPLVEVVVAPGPVDMEVVGCDAVLHEAVLGEDSLGSGVVDAGTG
jgi:hypothetical protein